MGVIKELSKQAFPLKVTIHKAIDETPDPVAEVLKLKKINTIWNKQMCYY